MLSFWIVGGGVFALLVLMRWRRRGSRVGMYRAFSYLKTTPGQEQVIRTELEKLRNATRELKLEARDARSELSEVVSQEQFDERRAHEWFAHRERAFDEVKPVFVDSLKEIHSVLDPEQRLKLAKVVGLGPQFFLSACGMRPWRARRVF